MGSQSGASILAWLPFRQIQEHLRALHRVADRHTIGRQGDTGAQRKRAVLSGGAMLKLMRQLAGEIQHYLPRSDQQQVVASRIQRVNQRPALRRGILHLLGEEILKSAAKAAQSAAGGIGGGDLAYANAHVVHIGLQHGEA